MCWAVEKAAAMVQCNLQAHEKQHKTNYFSHIY